MHIKKPRSKLRGFNNIEKEIKRFQPQHLLQLI
jgi:hypothetical protein